MLLARTGTGTVQIVASVTPDAVVLYASRTVSHNILMVLALLMQAGIQHSEGSVDAEFKAMDQVLQTN